MIFPNSHIEKKKKRILKLHKKLYAIIGMLEEKIPPNILESHEIVSKEKRDDYYFNEVINSLGKIMSTLEQWHLYLENMESELHHS